MVCHVQSLQYLHISGEWQKAFYCAVGVIIQLMCELFEYSAAGCSVVCTIGQCTTDCNLLWVLHSHPSDSAPKPPPAPPMSSVLVDQSSEEDEFVLPEGLSLPAGMATVSLE